MGLDLTGQRFGRLTARYDTGERRHRRPVWHCDCDCGNSVQIATSNLRSGNTRSCGCLRREIAATSPVMVGSLTVTHGGYNLPEYHVWEAMKARCLNTRNASYHNYGGRGIKVCERWLHSFTDFLADVGQRPPNPVGWTSRKHYWSLDRPNTDGDYEPGNVRWATYSEQRRNQRQRGGMQ